MSTIFGSQISHGGSILAQGATAHSGVAHGSHMVNTTLLKTLQQVNSPDINLERDLVDIDVLGFEGEGLAIEALGMEVAEQSIEDKKYNNTHNKKGKKQQQYKTNKKSKDAKFIINV